MMCQQGAFSVLDTTCPANPIWNKLGYCPDGVSIVETNDCVDPLLEGCDPAASPFGGGDGSEQDPYLICSAAQLHAVGDYDGDNFALVRALALGALIDGDALGYVAPTFAGRFDGRGHVIQASLSQSGDPGTGLFGTIEPGAEVHDLNLVGDFSSSSRGALLAHASGGSVANINVNAGVSSAERGGAIISSAQLTSDSYELRGYGQLTFVDFSGGIFAALFGTATRVRFDGSVSGVIKIGGLAGDLYQDALLREAHSLAEVDVLQNRGGCLTATVTGLGQLEDVVCDGAVTGAWVAGVSTEPHLCDPDGCVMRRALSRAAYGPGSSNIGAVTTSLGNGTFTGGDVFAVDAPPGAYSGLATLITAGEVFPGSPTIAALEDHENWSFKGGALGLAWDKDEESSCSPEAPPAVDCENGLSGLRLCLPGGVEVNDCLIDLN